MILDRASAPVLDPCTWTENVSPSHVFPNRKFLRNIQKGKPVTFYISHICSMFLCHFFFLKMYKNTYFLLMHVK